MGLITGIFLTIFIAIISRIFFILLFYKLIDFIDSLINKSKYNGILKRILDDFMELPDFISEISALTHIKSKSIKFQINFLFERLPYSCIIEDHTKYLEEDQKTKLKKKLSSIIYRVIRSNK